MAICSHCQSSMSDEADFCGYCGGHLDRKGDGAQELFGVDAGGYDKATSEEEWEPPDDKALVEITKAVADDLASGKSKRQVIADLVAYDGWTEQSAEGFVQQVEQELQRSASVTQFIEGAVRGGQTKDQIVTAMVESGWERKQAASWVSSVAWQMEGQVGQQYREFPVWDFLIGFVALGIGGAITLGTYTSAGPGETYWIVWGPMIYGGYRVLRGIVRLMGGGD